jgi:hypothetical protein
MIEPAANIKYLLRHEIDADKWDKCIANSFNGLIYARTVYLDTMSKNWSGLIFGDYESIMPLTWNKKYGFSYLYQPAFTAQLGVFSPSPIDQELMSTFINEAKKRFRFCEIHLNYANNVKGGIPRANYVLDLNKPYDQLVMSYKKRLLENLKEADSGNLEYTSSLDFCNTVASFESEYGQKMQGTKKIDYRNFENLCHTLKQTGVIFQRIVKDISGNILTGSIFLKDENRIYNIMSVTVREGRKKRSHFYLIDQMIREFSGQNLIFDFEGSEVPGIAEFYQKFGSLNQPYIFFRYNELPYALRFLKSANRG